MTRIDTTRTHRSIDAGQRMRRKDRAAEAMLLAAGIVFGGLLVSAKDAYGAGPQGLQVAAAPTASMLSTASTDPDGLDLSMPETSHGALETGSTPTYDRNDGARVTDLDGQTRLHGVHRLEIDLYADEMRPRAGRSLR
ncbi:hypothetical protein CKO28_25775 [Rhodovibrio sodomensis]|uniref:LPS export ABC transporter periplasmic protein LptC n=1 Tax=Rhodovibrio sodomensis TaxID=1088 RepID=A0ABS1DMG2_9PROT|nr:hypothetical protein [Rhodovibrio sodomensis]MBK1671414.1 hypothetical protein [Rhodovibrio sodomensis]